MTDRTADYTIPGGIKLFFEEGFNSNTGFRDMGNLVTTELEPAIEVLDHFTNRGGARAKDKTSVQQSSIALNFTFDEPNPHNLKYFLLAGALTSVIAGSVSIPREILKLTGTDPIATSLPMAVNHGVTVYTIADTPVLLVNNIVTGGGDYDVVQAASTVARTVGGDITDGQEVMVTYNAQLPAHTSMPVLNSPIIEGRARLIITPTSGVQVVWAIPKVNIKPAGTFTLGDQDWMQAPMVLDILADTANNPSAPFGTMRTWTE